MKRLDRRPIDLGPDEILGFARIRNETLRLPWCLDYHRRLGVDRFFIVDNNSHDGSADYLLSRDDVHLFWTDAPYAQNHSGVDWVNELLAEYASGHWTLTFDADELLIYPAIEQIKLRQFVQFLDANGADALECTMVDMYGSAAIRDTRYRQGQDFLEVCPYFDGEPLLGMRGGVRERLFWRSRSYQGPTNAPYLSKKPLTRWRSGLKFAASTHIIDGVVSSQLRGAMLHFKMFHDFHQRAVAAVEGKQFWQGSAQYAVYLDGMNEQPGATGLYEKSQRFERSDQLVDLGLMTSSADYELFVGTCNTSRANTG